MNRSAVTPPGAMTGRHRPRRRLAAVGAALSTGASSGYRRRFGSRCSTRPMPAPTASMTRSKVQQVHTVVERRVPAGVTRLARCRYRCVDEPAVAVGSSVRLPGPELLAAPRSPPGQGLVAPARLERSPCR